MSKEYFFEPEGCFITELSNTPDDPALSIAQARVEPGKTTAWHLLRDTTERYVIVSGVGRVEIGACEPAIVKEGDVVIIEPMQRQRISNIGDTDLVFFALCTPRFEAKNYQAIEEPNTR